MAILGLLLLWGFLFTGLYGLYVMVAVPQTISWMGLTATGGVGGIVALLMEGYLHIEAIVMRVLAMSASWGEYAFVGGLIFMVAVFAWNAISTHGATVVR